VEAVEAVAEAEEEEKGEVEEGEGWGVEEGEEKEQGRGGGRMGGGLLRRNSRALTKLNPCLDQSKGEERVNVRV